jgi:hypothetical protein
MPRALRSVSGGVDGVSIICQSAWSAVKRNGTSAPVIHNPGTLGLNFDRGVVLTGNEQVSNQTSLTIPKAWTGLFARGGTTRHPFHDV